MDKQQKKNARSLKGIATAVGTGALALVGNASAAVDITAATGALGEAGTAAGAIGLAMVAAASAGIAYRWVVAFLVK